MYTLLSLLLCATLSTAAPADTVQAAAVRPVERATMYGLGWANQYDTYLSPQEYRGIEFRLSRESLRRTRWADGRLNGNNPANARAAVAVDASVAAVWDFRVRRVPLRLRYQLDVPLLGAMFSPHYGQSYYEIFSLGNAGGVVKFTSLHNRPSWRHRLSLDFPVGRLKMRFTYLWDVQQSKLNHIETHAYGHIFMVGFVKQFSLLPPNR